MDSITFTDNENTGVSIVINGRDLRDIVRAVELPFATREGSPRIAGAYAGLPAEVVFWPSRHLLGRPDPLYSEDDSRVHVLGCECGEPGCWPLAVRIDIRDREVIWRDFYQPHRGPESKAGHWQYDTMPEFRFERHSYEQALSVTTPKAEPGASPNGGPATSLGHSGVTEGPPSVS
jgi:hypothetical protein